MRRVAVRSLAGSGPKILSSPVTFLPTVSKFVILQILCTWRTFHDVEFAWHLVNSGFILESRKHSYLKTISNTGTEPSGQCDHKRKQTNVYTRLKSSTHYRR